MSEPSTVQTAARVAEGPFLVSVPHPSGLTRYRLTSHVGYFMGRDRTFAMLRSISSLRQDQVLSNAIFR